MRPLAPLALFRTRPRSSVMLAIVGAAIVNIGVATAQEAQNSPPVTEPSATADGASTGVASAGAVAADIEAKDELTLSPAEMSERSALALAAIDAAQTTVGRMVAAAKDNRDVVKVLCLDDKSSQVGVAFRTAQDRRASLSAAIEAGVEERARHEFTLLMVLKERVDMLLSEANQCIGEETGFTGEAELIVEVDPNLPEVEPEVVTIAPATVIEPAEISSPS